MKILSKNIFYLILKIKFYRKITKFENLLEKIKDLSEYSQLCSEIQSKLKILNALIDNNKEVNELISKSETEKGNEELIKKEEIKKEEQLKLNEEDKNKNKNIE